MKKFCFDTHSLQPILFFILTRICTSLHTINTSHSLRYGETLVSPGQIYELGFFSLSDPNTKYLGIWYKKISPRTIVWVANRDTPLSSSPGSLNITSQGNLVLVDITNRVYWSSNSSFVGAKDPVAILLDSGNFVVREGNDSNPDKFLWQSFDFPVDTFVPGLRLGRNLVTGKETYLSSWKSIDDPSPGKFSVRLDLRGYPQLLVKRENRTMVRTGYWNGLRFQATADLDPFVVSKLVQNEQEVYYTYELLNSTLLLRARIDQSGVLQRFFWNNHDDYWSLLATAPVDQCSHYALCGGYASCEANNVSRCVCLEGFIPKNPKDWNVQIRSGGCVPKTPINCDGKVGFLKHTRRKLPDTSSCWYNKSIELEECESLCLKNCSCTAYANLDMRNGGSGCLLWFVGLIDIRGLGADGQDLFIKIDASELARIEAEKSSGKKKTGIAAGVVAMVISTVMIFCILRRNLKKQGFKLDENSEEIELPKFDFAIIADATNNFSSDNKLGEGGFGTVYKGIMKVGKEIAVKRLSRGSSQGLSEFKNEVILIAKLQHRNLVKLLGFCIHADEKMLIYEYMPNKRLDTFIFDQTKSQFLDWKKRINIINGVARGLLCLHQDSRLRIIHRDLKISNILLDRDLNPKISDFGLARTFWEDQTEDRTMRVVGTYGYMSPKYAVYGSFSMKSDVFSFGVMVLEIVSGKKNKGFGHPEQCLNLPGHAWMLWGNRLGLELIDECLTESCIESELVRCINVALLCVQQRPEDRPSMSSVVVMLSSEISLPSPKEPGFFLQIDTSRANQQHQSCSANTVTTSDLEAR